MSSSPKPTRKYIRSKLTEGLVLSAREGESSLPVEANVDQKPLSLSKGKGTSGLKSVLKNKLKRIRVLRYLWKAVTLPRRMVSLQQDMARLQQVAAETRSDLAEMKLNLADSLSAFAEIKANLADSSSAFAEIKASFADSSAWEKAMIPIIALHQKVDAALEAVSQTSAKTDQLIHLGALSQDKLINAKTTVFSTNDGVIAIQVQDYIMGIPAKEWRLAMYLSKYGYFEHGSEKAFCSLLTPDMTVVDVGANLGIYTLHAASRGCEVYAYEASPETFALLKENIAANGFEPSGRVHSYNLAVAEQAGKVRFTTLPAFQSSNMFELDSGNSVEMESISLDEHLSSLPQIDLVKIDVEGAELLVLKGMHRIISNNPGIKILIEFAPSNLVKAGVEPDQLLSLIREDGFTINLVDESTGTYAPVQDAQLRDVYSVNLLLSR